jgi:hypothetical protein
VNHGLPASFPAREAAPGEPDRAAVKPRATGPGVTALMIVAAP